MSKKECKIYCSRVQKYVQVKINIGRRIIGNECENYDPNSTRSCTRSELEVRPCEYKVGESFLIPAIRTNGIIP